MVKSELKIINYSLFTRTYLKINIRNNLSPRDGWGAR